MQARQIFLVLALVGGVLLGGCREGATPNPAPSLTSLSPSSATAGGSAFALTVTGNNFVSSSAVQWNGSNRATTLLSSTQLAATIPASDIAAAGTAQVTVVSPAPGGGTSTALTLTINNPVPTITTLIPSNATARGAAFMLTLGGSDFVSTSVVRWNGSDRTTTVASGTQLTAAILAADIALAGTVAVTVLNPAPGGGTSNALPFTITPVPGVIERVSVASDGSQADGDSGFSSVSADGRFVAFASVASNLVVGDTNGSWDVFVRDTCLGAAGCTPSTVRVSVASDSSQGNAGSGFPAISADGRFVAFNSSANNLVAGDTNGWGDVFVRDTCVGAASCTPSTVRASVATDGSQGNGSSFHPAISADSRFVAFPSYANNLVAGDTDGWLDIFVRDTCAGAAACTPATTRVSVSNDGSQANSASQSPAISADGRFVAFVSQATNLVAGDTNGWLDIFLRDTCAGAAGCTPDTVRVSVASDGSQAGLHSDGPTISSDGRFVAFHSATYNLVVGDTNNAADVFLRDTCIGAVGCTPSTVRVSVASDGSQGNDGSAGPAISADGRFVTFISAAYANTLVANDSNGYEDVFVRDTCLGAAGCTPATVRVSLLSDGTETNFRSSRPVISADGRFVAFESGASNLVPGDTNNKWDIFLARTGF